MPHGLKFSGDRPCRVSDAKRPLNVLTSRGKCGSLIAEPQNGMDKIQIIGVRCS